MLQNPIDPKRGTKPTKIKKKENLVPEDTEGAELEDYNEFYEIWTNGLLVQKTPENYGY